jgi:hypothetical protein
LKAALTAIAFATLLSTPAYAQRIVDAPQVAGWGHAACRDLVPYANDATVQSQVAQWTVGYYSGLLALDIEGAVPAFSGLTNWLVTNGANEGDVTAPIGARLVAQCQADPSLSVEVAAQRVAMALAAESRGGGAK